jgi:hypothetical protein
MELESSSYNCFANSQKLFTPQSLLNSVSSTCLLPCSPGMVTSKTGERGIYSVNVSTGNSRDDVGTVQVNADIATD